MAVDNKGRPDEHTEKLLKRVVENFAKEDRSVRERQLRQWKRLKYYWEGFQRMWWSETAHDWRVYDESLIAQSSQDSSFYDKRINVFKSYLESIIAALSVNIPPILCYPDDAENALDIDTSKAGNIIGKQIYQHNNAAQIWIYALYIYCTEGLIGCYNYTDKKKEYGTYKQDNYDNVEEEQQMMVCPLCQTNMASPDLSNAERNEFDPDDNDALAKDVLQMGDVCPQCLAQVHPELITQKVIVQRFVGSTDMPKARQCMDIYGGLFVKVPNYAKKQCDIPYLFLEQEFHYAVLMEQYEWLRDKFVNARGFIGETFDPYGRWARLSIQYKGEFPLDVITKRECWLRPCAFNILPDEEDVKYLKKQFPDGCKVTLLNEELATVCNQNLDDHWTLTKNPLADYLHHDPLGMLLTSVQEITNDLIALALQQIEHSVGQVLADPTTLDFEAYRNTEIAPGSITPATPKSGKALGDSFYEFKPATFSGEILPFGQQIQSLGQMVSGAQPSLFGGEMGKTASEYSMARAQSLQRLQTPWKMLCIWWKEIFGKVIPAYIKDVVEDEKFVDKTSDGSFVNCFIRKSQLLGKIGRVELEAAENLPITWGAQKDVLMQLMQSQNPEVLQALMAPENLALIKRAIGIEEFVVPGEDDRTKQYEEIQQLLASEPIMMMNQMGMPEETPTVDIEPQIDNNMIHADICRAWAVSERGRLAKVENPGGYKNVLLHMQRHINVMQAMSAMNAPQPPQPNQGQQGQNTEMSNGGNSGEQ